MAIVGVGIGMAFGALYTLADVNKTVSVQITNDSHTDLINPELNMLSGKVYSVLPEIKGGQIGRILFHKTPMAMLGVVGAFTYELKGENIKAAIYYENPLIGNNWFGLRWYDKSAWFDKSVVDDWERMETDMWKVESPIKHHQIQRGSNVVRGLMSQGQHAELDIVFK